MQIAYEERKIHSLDARQPVTDRVSCYGRRAGDLVSRNRVGKDCCGYEGENDCEQCAFHGSLSSAPEVRSTLLPRDVPGQERNCVSRHSTPKDLTQRSSNNSPPQRRSIAGDSISLTHSRRCACARRPPRDGSRAGKGRGGKSRPRQLGSVDFRSFEYFNTPVSCCGEQLPKLDNALVSAPAPVPGSHP